MNLVVGLDVSLEKTSACVVSEHGRIVREAEIASEPDALAAFAQDQPGEVARDRPGGRAPVAMAPSRAERGGTRSGPDGDAPGQGRAEGDADSVVCYGRVKRTDTRITQDRPKRAEATPLRQTAPSAR